MEKYSQYRDKGSGIAPFFPIAPPPTSLLLFPIHLFLFSLRLPLLLSFTLIWLSITQWLAPGSLPRKANLWCLLGIPGVWWTDLQIDGVRRGELATKDFNNPSSKQKAARHLPGPGTIIACSSTSPLDVLYLAAIFDPIFTQSYAGSRLVQPISLFAALQVCFTLEGAKSPPTAAAGGSNLISLSTLSSTNPHRILVLFPEATPSNSRAILQLTPSLLSASASTKCFAVSLRYTPAEIVTPLPGWREAGRFAWRLCSRPTHVMRVRIGAPKTVGVLLGENLEVGKGNVKEGAEDGRGEAKLDEENANAEPPLTAREQRALDAVADDLARLGRVRRVALGVEDKARFVEARRRGRKTKVR